MSLPPEDPKNSSFSGIIKSLVHLKRPKMSKMKESEAVLDEEQDN